MVRELADGLVAFGDDADDLSLAGLHLLDVAHYLVVVAAPRGYDHHGHLLVYQRYRSVLHLGCGIAFGMDVGYFLEFQCPLEGDGIVVSASEVEEVPRVSEGLCELGYLGVMLEYLGDLVGNPLELSDYGGASLCIHGSQLLCKAQGDQREHCHLGSERLRRRHSYLGTYVRVAAGVGGPGDRRTHDIADSEQERPGLACELQRGQRVGSLARLRYRYHHVVLRYDGLAVAEFRRVLDFDRDARELLYDVLAYHAGVPRGAAGADDEALGAEQSLAVVYDARELDYPELGVQPALHRYLQGAWLLEYLLEHEMGIPSLLDLAQAHLQLAYHRSLPDLSEVCYAQRLALGDEGDLLLVEVHDLVGIFDYGRCVRGYEILSVPDAYDERASLAGRDHAAGPLPVYHCEGVCPHNVPERQGYRFLEGDSVRVHDILEELYQHLGVGLAAEMVAEVGKLLLQGEVVLYDAVVYDGEPAVLRHVRMRVDVVRLPVCGPPRMGYACAPAAVLAFHKVFEILDLASGLVDQKFAGAVQQRHSGAIVAPVFEPLKPFYQYRVRLAVPDISYYSTHILTL